MNQMTIQMTNQMVIEDDDSDDDLEITSDSSDEEGYGQEN